MVHWNQMPCVVHDPEIQIPHLLLRPSCFAIHLPDVEQSTLELGCVLVEHLIHPPHCPWVLDDDVILSIINQNWQVSSQKLLH